MGVYYWYNKGTGTTLSKGLEMVKVNVENVLDVLAYHSKGTTKRNLNATLKELLEIVYAKEVTFSNIFEPMFKVGNETVLTYSSVTTSSTNETINVNCKVPQGKTFTLTFNE